MQVGDIVKHKYGTLQGQGLVLPDDKYYDSRAVTTLWTSHGVTKIQYVATQYLEVVNASR